MTAPAREFFLFDTEPDAVFDNLTQLVCTSLDVPIALMSLVSGERQFFKSHCGLPEPWSILRQTPLSHSFCQHVVAMGRELLVEDAMSHPLVSGNLAIEDMGVVAYLGQPIHDVDERTIGSLCAIDTKVRRWTDRDRATLKLVACLVDKGIRAAAAQKIS